MMPKKRTPAIDAMLWEEAKRRAVSLKRRNRFSTKELATMSGLKESFCASLISKMRREIEITIRGTPNVNSQASNSE